jgi:hypothetical protein
LHPVDTWGFSLQILELCLAHNVQQKINRSKIFLDRLLCSNKFKLFLTSFCRTHSGDNKPCSVVKKRKKKKWSRNLSTVKLRWSPFYHTFFCPYIPYGMVVSNLPDGL